MKRKYLGILNENPQNKLLPTLKGIAFVYLRNRIKAISALENKPLKGMIRNETASSLGNRIVEDEREEISKANCSLNLMSRFFTTADQHYEKANKFKNFNVWEMRPKTSLFEYESKCDDYTPLQSK